jgi:hypothetical protein
MKTLPRPKSATQKQASVEIATVRAMLAILNGQLSSLLPVEQMTQVPDVSLADIKRLRARCLVILREAGDGSSSARERALESALDRVGANDNGLLELPEADEAVTQTMDIFRDDEAIADLRGRAA